MPLADISDSLASNYRYGNIKMESESLSGSLILLMLLSAKLPLVDVAHQSNTDILKAVIS